MLAMRFDMNEVARMPAGTTFYDSKGVEITAPGGAGRKLIKRQDIPDFLVKSLQAREDARFFQHHGVDVRGLARATVRNLKDWDFTQGASTLSMQLARNSFKIKQKSLHRKFLEIALTLRVESRYTKDEILTHYLNRIYFGAGADGIEQAARTYFGKTTRELSDGECALIVGIIRGPHVFSPFRNLDAAIEQRNQTLNRMIAMGIIDRPAATPSPPPPVKLADDEQRDDQTSYALRPSAANSKPSSTRATSNSADSHVHTTLNIAWQQRLESELTRAVEDLEHEKSWAHPTHEDHRAGSDTTYVQYAAVTTETRTGGILALIGGRDFRHSRFDRTRTRRDLGSAFEPFVAAAAAERGKLVLPGKPVQTGRQIGPAEVERVAKRCGIAGPFLDNRGFVPRLGRRHPAGNVGRSRHPRQQGQTPGALSHPRNPRPPRAKSSTPPNPRPPRLSARPPPSMPPRCCAALTEPATSPAPPARNAKPGPSASAPAAPPPSGSASTNPPPSPPNRASNRC